MNKNIKKSLAVLAVTLSLIGCKAKEAIEATTQMPAEMNDMQSRMDHTNGLITSTNRGMQETNDAIHNQILLVSMDEMLKEENTVDLSIPTRMIGPAVKFAEEATPEELAKIAFLWIKEIEEGGDTTPEEQATLTSEESRLPEAERERLLEERRTHLTQERRGRIDHAKLVKLTALNILAAVTPQEKVVSMIQEQIHAEGRYHDAVLGLLALRATYLQSFFLDTGLLSGDKIQRVGDLKQAIDYMTDIEYVLDLPFASGIQLNLTGFINNDLDRSITVSGSENRAALVISPWLKIEAASVRIAASYNGQNSTTWENPGRSGNVADFNRLSEEARSRADRYCAGQPNLGECQSRAQSLRDSLRDRPAAAPAQQ